MVAELRDLGSRARPKPPVEKMTPSGAERRREPRYPCNDPVEIRILPDRARVPATLMDVSRSGLRIEIDVPLVKSTEIEILLPKQMAVTGRVRHCRRVGQKYQAGILIQKAIDASRPNDHVSDEQLNSYLNGRGLTLSQVIRVRDHLAACSNCRLRIVDSYSVKPQSRRNS